MDNRVAKVLEYAKKMSDEGLCGNNDYIAVRIDDNDMYITKAPLAELTEEDVVKEIYVGGVSAAAAILNTYEVNAIIYAHPEKACVAARAGRAIPAVLDDMAQIVGHQCKVAVNRTEKIILALKGANSILVQDDGALTTGRTLDEAFTCLRVLEKSARVNIAVSVLGGCKKISWLDAKLMRFVYKMKYSKQNQKNKALEEI